MNKLDSKMHMTCSDGDCISLQQVLTKTSVELRDLVTLCTDVEDVIGDIIETQHMQSNAPIVALQGLDRLRQSIEDFARLTDFLLTQSNLPTHTVSGDAIRSILSLDSLAGRLTHVSGQIDQSNEQDVIWDLS